MRGRGLTLAVSVAMCTGGFMVAVRPASAEKRTITVTLLGGGHLTLTVDVPPGTPLDQIKLPSIHLPIIGISESGPPPPPATTAPATPTPAQPAAPSPTPVKTAPATRQRSSGTRKRRSVIHVATPATPGAGQPTAGVRVKPPAARTPQGAPTPANPTFSLATPGPAAIGVPNFFIEQFRIPPFLLP
ncbi:MAG: peptidoglycan DD-metalloendopeptidase family protein, partial [Solirubrobacterales bacterium]|nr:peptidoglycan DD-metalloendopeptidase family protein [Solirubrobacterales bacterium]